MPPASGPGSTPRPRSASVVGPPTGSSRACRCGSRSVRATSSKRQVTVVRRDDGCQDHRRPRRAGRGGDPGAAMRRRPPCSPQARARRDARTVTRVHRRGSGGGRAGRLRPLRWSAWGRRARRRWLLRRSRCVACKDRTARCPTPLRGELDARRRGHRRHAPTEQGRQRQSGTPCRAAILRRPTFERMGGGVGAAHASVRSRVTGGVRWVQRNRHGLAKTVTSIVAPSLRALGVELVDVEHRGVVVRVVVDEPGGIGLDRLGEVTQQVSDRARRGRSDPRCATRSRSRAPVSSGRCGRPVTSRR